jgi:hypothetical protein
MHLNEEQLQRLLHQQLAPGASRMAREHLTECTECRERLALAEQDEAWMFALLRRLDHPAPAVDAATVAARARGQARARVRWAAGILLFLAGAGAAYAMPGSPLRHWVRSVLTRVIGSEQLPAPTQGTDGGTAGIAALPGEDFVIAFQSPEPGGVVRVSLTNGDEVTVRAPGRAASFTSGAERLVVHNTGTGAGFEIEIPRAAPRVEILVVGRRIFLKDGSRIVTDGPRVAEGHYLLPLSPP